MSYETKLTTTNLFPEEIVVVMNYKISCCLIYLFHAFSYSFFSISLYPPIPRFSHLCILAIVVELIPVFCSIFVYFIPLSSICATFHLCPNSIISFSVSRSLKNLRASSIFPNFKMVPKRALVSLFIHL